MADYNSDRTGSNIDAVLDKADNLTQAAVGVGGSVGIGTAIPSQELHVVGSGAGQVSAMFESSGASTSLIGFNNTSATNSSQVAFGSTGNHAIVNAGGSERARIDSSGNLLVGKTSLSTSSVGVELRENGKGMFTASGTDPVFVNRLSSDGDILKFAKDNGIVGSISVAGSTTSYNTSSDERLKENIQDTTHSVDIDDIQVREFDWKVDGSHQRYGFIAQELETVYPEAVHSPEDPKEMKSVDYSKLVPLLVKEIQTLKARIEELEK